MLERYNHLRLQRLVPVNPRRVRPGRSNVTVPSDPRAHAQELSRQLERVVITADKQEPGFDPNLLLKIKAVGIQPDDLESIEGLRVVSQEGSELVVLFASQEGLDEFRRRLAQMSRGEVPTRKDIIFAVKGIEGWTPEDRQGPALRQEGIPEEEPFIVDVELWPLERGPRREQMLNYFENWYTKKNIVKIDRVNQENIVMYRLKVTRESLQAILLHRDVRLVDLPPRYQLSVSLVHMSLRDLPEIPSPPDGAPGVVVLDSGVATGHPLLASAIGDAQSFFPGLGPQDESGHGTMVCGLALYGDIEKCLTEGRFIPEFRIFSGRIIDAANRNDTGFVENHIIAAVKYFVEHYNCRIFNLSFGDLRKIYLDGHVRGLATVLDSLAREYQVLFVVSAGNFEGTDVIPVDWRSEYPDYLFSPEARIIDPAPALNVLTVGSLARYEQPRMGQRHPHDVGYQPIARRDQPSPFTRTGPGPRKAIKPEVVEYGGNFSVDLRLSNHVAGPTDGLGEISTSHNFATGNLFKVDRGTSFAAPKIAYLAGLLLRRYPDAGPNLLRALIVAHSRCPEATINLFNGDLEKAFNVVGYGKPDWEKVVYSFENKVTLINQEEIEGESHHFYEIPLPEDFFGPPARRLRRITVALAHTPLVRRTRINYKASAINFRVVKNNSLDNVVRVFRYTPREEREKLIREAGNFIPKARFRNNGTVQAATWDLSQVDSRWGENRLFVVVTRTVEPWAKDIFDREPYALVVVIEDCSNQQVRYYSQVRQILRARVRV